MSHGLGHALGATEGLAGGRHACHQGQRRPCVPRAWGTGVNRGRPSLGPRQPLPALLGVLRLLPPGPPTVPPHPPSLTVALGCAGREAQGPFGSVTVIRVRALGRPSAQGLEDTAARAVGTALVGVGHLQGPGWGWGGGTQPP